MPFSGEYQLTPEEAMVAKIPLLHGETDDATAMSYGYIPGVARYSPLRERPTPWWRACPSWLPWARTP
mgnify:FL=1